MKPNSVIIIGGGIAGLTTAHELLELNYDVTLIERNDIVGGIARTYQNNTCPYEYSWRAYGSYYNNVFDIMSRIKLNDDKTVLDNLIDVSTINNLQSVYLNKHCPIGHFYELGKLCMSDYLKLLPSFIDFIIHDDNYNQHFYSSLNYRKFLQDKHISTVGINRLGKMIGPFWGLDYNNASVYDIYKIINMLLCNDKGHYYITKYPTNYAWFDPWLLYLKQIGLKLYLNTEVTKLNINDGIISDIKVLNKVTNTTFTLRANYYACCTGPEILYKLIEPFEFMNLYVEKIRKVSKNGEQIQMSVYYYIDKPIGFSNGYIYLPNTPWLLIIIPYAAVWGDDFLNRYCNNKIKDVMSVGICQPYEKGLLIKKPWSECTPEEIKIEAWYQLMNDKDFKREICVDSLDINIIDFKLWPSYNYNTKTNKLETYEPKWANNMNTAENRPSTISPISNLFIGGTYTNTSVYLAGMEGAVESGKRVAYCISRNSSIKIFKKKYSFFQIKFVRNIILIVLIIWFIYFFNLIIAENQTNKIFKLLIF